MDNTFDEFTNEDCIPTPAPEDEKALYYKEEPTHFPISRQNRDLMIVQARELRKHPTKAEALLWCELRTKKLAGFRFRRQHIIGSFIVDFYCPMRKLVIEIDGPIHKNQKVYDEIREEHLKAMGYTVIRFSNQQVEDCLSDILQEILMMLSEGKEQ